MRRGLALVGVALLLACDGLLNFRDDYVLRDAGEPPCMQGQTRSCYDGPNGTANVGLCRSGTQTCASPSWSACTGQTLPVVEDVSTPDDDDCDGYTGNFIEARVYGQPNTSVDVVPPGTDGIGVAVAATIYTGSINFGGDTFLPIDNQGNGDMVLASLTIAGHRWSKEFGGPAIELVTSVAATPMGDILLSGTIGSTDFGLGPITRSLRIPVVVRFDSAGAPRWNKVFDSKLGGLYVVPDKESVVIAGRAADVQVPGGPLLSGQNALVTLMNAQGGHQWTRSFPVVSPNEDASACGIAAGNGRYAFAFAFSKSADIDGHVLQATSTYARVITMLDFFGKPVWEQMIGSGGGANDGAFLGIAVGVLADGVVGALPIGLGLDIDGTTFTTKGAFDMLVLKYDLNGKLLWARQLGGDNSEVLPSLTVDTSGSIVLSYCETDNSNHFAPPSDGKAASTIVRLDPVDGRTHWSRRIENAFVRGVTVLANGDVFTTGSIRGPTSLGGDTVNGAIFLARYAP